VDLHHGVLDVVFALFKSHQRRIEDIARRTVRQDISSLVEQTVEFDPLFFGEVVGPVEYA
jgi:hypothetical protein